MAYFSLRELGELEGVRDDVKSAVLRLMNLFEQQRPGKHLTIPPDGGFRTHARQQQLYTWAQQDAANGEHYATATPGKSAHEWGAGVDVRVVSGGTDDDYKLIAQLAPQVGLRSGYSFGDPFHLEAPESLDVWQAKYAANVGRGLPVLAVAFAAVAAVVAWRAFSDA